MSSDLTPLFAPHRLDGLRLPNRIVMAPLTRNRAGPGGVPGELAVEYYRQRASAGLIVAEMTQPTAEGQTYARTPGIHDPAQIAAWRRVTDAVHGAGGRIFLQIGHGGRASHPLNNGGHRPVAPSALGIADGAKVFTDQAGWQGYVAPRELTAREVEKVVAAHGATARNAMAAGFDGVELHAASGYLPMQFLAPSANRRTDRYGGSVENRTRFVVEALAAMAEGAGGAHRVGIRVSPGLAVKGIEDPDPAATYAHLARAIDGMDLAYLHVMRVPDFLPDPHKLDAVWLLRPLFRGTLIAAGNHDARSAAAAIRAGRADLVAFGRAFIANPDLVERIRRGAPLARDDKETWYTPGPHGYVDYPALAPRIA